jgi:hypothetical protein
MKWSVALAAVGAMLLLSIAARPAREGVRNARYCAFPCAPSLAISMPDSHREDGVPDSTGQIGWTSAVSVFLSFVFFPPGRSAALNRRTPDLMLKEHRRRPHRPPISVRLFTA